VIKDLLGAAPAPRRDVATRHERYRAAVAGESTDRPPIWLMRQAGRYLPEYRAIRARHSFWDLCLRPEVSAAATLTARIALDADLMIIFNDILTPLRDMGLEVDFSESGPVIANPVRTMADVEALVPPRYGRPPVAESLRTVRAADPDTPVLGFCGAPYTLAVYAVEGAMRGDKSQVAGLAAREPAAMERLLATLAEVAADYLVAQVAEGGAHGVQLFESWGGVLLAGAEYEALAARWQRHVIARFRAACPGVPVHLYVRGSRAHLESMVRTGAEVISVDEHTPLAAVRAAGARCVQGNLAPATMLPGAALDDAMEAMIAGFDWHRGWIANLGHGITPAADPHHARRFVQWAQSLANRSRPT
jgi:uroporphyrinogen decarboxylase